MNKVLFWITIVFFLAFGVIFGIQWIKTNENISEIKKQNREYFEKIKTLKDYGPFQLDFKKLNENQVIINPEEIEKINKHISTLTEQVYSESNRVQFLIDKDIDRLNLYMAIGIGFLTIIGIFVPVVLNVLNYQDIRDKQNALDKRFDKIDLVKIDKAITDSEKAIQISTLALESADKVDRLSESVTKVENDIKETFPKVSMLTLQYAIIRYFYIAPYLMTNLIREKDSKAIADLIISIRNGFDECKNNSSLNDVNLQSTISDFVIFIREPRFHSLFLSKKITNEFFDLSGILEKLLKDKNEEHYQLVDTKLNQIVESIRNYNVKTQPTT
jgi:hypothetical protein